MARIWIITVMTVVVVVSSFGCGQQGASNSPSGSTEQTTSPRQSSEQATTTEETIFEATTALGVLECPTDSMVSGVDDYATGAKGEEGTPVEIARRQFSEKIKEGDAVEIADRSRGQNVKATVRVIREGRVAALIEYRRSGGGWLRDLYEACSDF